MKRFTRILTFALTVAMLVSCVPAMAESAETVNRATVPVYLFDSTNVSSMDLVFFTEEKDIPYIALDNIAQMLRELAQSFGDTGFDISDGFYTYDALVEANQLSVPDEWDGSVSVFKMERENGAFAIFDAENDIIWMSDRDKFFTSSYSVSGGDLVSSNGIYYTNEERTETAVNLYKRANSSGSKFVRGGDVTQVDLVNYGIDIVMLDSKVYVPVATASDLLMPIPMSYNGEALFLTINSLDNNAVNDDGKTMKELYYQPAAKERSESLAVFNYYELCLMLDQCYGLYNEHQIGENFDSYFTATGLAAQLCSTDVTVYTEAMNQLLAGYFGDLHSALRCATPYGGSDVIIPGENESISVTEYLARQERFIQAREAAGITQNGQIIDGYTEIGDTAFITFDSFTAASMDYYKPEILENFKDYYMSDTISLVAWSQAMIHRDNSPIKKVVIDLSCNGGGSLDACVYIAAWVLGSCSLNIENVRTGAQYTTTYWVDTTLDGYCRNDDDLGVDNLDVYCLISGNSFSCGNLLPAMFKEDGRVTLVGQASGGGSCIVRNAAAADGTLFSISDYMRMSIVKNGSFYSIDEGVEPDIPLRKCASYYDREGLMEYLANFR